MIFQNWTRYCFMRAFPHNSKKSNRRVDVTSERGSMFKICASHHLSHEHELLLLSIGTLELAGSSIETDHPRHGF